MKTDLGDDIPRELLEDALAVLRKTNDPTAVVYIWGFAYTRDTLADALRGKPYAWMQRRDGAITLTPSQPRRYGFSYERVKRRARA